MCLTFCSVAIEFSILRATSVSICAGDAPGSEAVTVIVGRSMSGKFWIFIARKPSRPTSVSMMNSRIAGVGLRIDQAETFIWCGLTSSPSSARLARGLAAARAVDHAHRVAVAEEAAARGHDARVGVQAAGDLDAVADAPADRDLGLADLRVRRRRAARS